MSRSKFLHEEIYRGQDYLKKLSNLHVIICGAGAIGSNLVDTISRQGVSNLKVIDKDRVESHNTSTQIWGDMDVGALKADALKNRVFRHVGVEITAISKELTAGNAKTLLKGAFLVIDGFDNSESRKIVQDECRKQKLNLLHCGLHGEGGYGEVIWDDRYKVPANTTGDVCDYPLARNLITMTTSIAAEEILDFCLATKPRKTSWTITLKDLAIRQF